MITSLLDNDQYKFTMQQATLKLGFAATPVQYKFKCRTPNIDFNPYIKNIKEQISALAGLKLEKTELEFLRGIRYLSEEYLSFLKNFRFDPDLVKCSILDNELSLLINGPWFQTILFEVPILAIISEIYTTSQPEYSIRVAHNNLSDKIDFLLRTPDIGGFKFSELGTRRRASLGLQYRLISRLKTKLKQYFTGTSNLYLAMQHDVPSFGTMAHEWLQAHQQLGYRVADSQKMAFENWVKVYRGDLGIALSDVINTDAFLKDFNDPLFYKLFDGVREDSEPTPANFAYKMIRFYSNRNIEPMRKNIVFSNSLNFEKSVELFTEFKHLIGTRFGIGTFLSNDCGVKPLNIVIKMIRCNGQPVAKISNSPGKGMCPSPEFETYLKSVYGV